ncbi:uncharacterized protein EKO05_0003690 [Ascochyta rabiei]|uniref:uncharacterized protein n=1 Tax=Didymella rabiei TaxID=5454 RepID=UPI00190016CE|nr:uncharacterized protein EKO05_0003690 [Ascochyta rabiei]UPX13164.1 hypothetical protein EKO05_0003690 [Ascochyta rabiei]
MGYRLDKRGGRMLQEGLSDTCDAGKGRTKGSYLYGSQLSHFSSCLTVLTFETPQFALLDAAHGASSIVEWPQPYLCTTFVHMLAEIGEDASKARCVARREGGRLVRAALRVVGGGQRGWSGGGARRLVGQQQDRRGAPSELVADGRHPWALGQDSDGARLDEMEKWRIGELVDAWVLAGAGVCWRAAGGRLVGAGGRLAGVWQEMGWELQEGQAAGCGAASQGSSPAKWAAEQSNDNRSVPGEDGTIVPKGAAGAAGEFYKTNIAACRTDGTSGQTLDYCRCPFATRVRQSCTAVGSVRKGKD